MTPQTNGISPNHGAAVEDLVAMGSDQETVKGWRQRCNIKPDSQIRLVKLAHMRYQHPDLETITTFLEDFGMVVVQKTDDRVWYRGYGTDQYVYFAQKGPKKFLGGAFEVESYEDLEKATKVPSASEIQELADAPGGGHMVTLTDPDGFPMNLIFGQTPAIPGKTQEKLVPNYPDEKPRIRKFQRFNTGPAAVHKLGHFGVCTTKFDSLVDFYTSNFNIVPTDFLYIEEPQEDTTTADSETGTESKEQKKRKNVALFAHIDRGADYVDHHTFFMSSNPTSHVHHCSFEVHDFDTQKLGHAWLAKKGYRSVWGVGRHILGSQIFDYWWDTTGNMIEHYADGDLVNENTPIGYGPAGHESLAVWGPEIPSWFLE